MTSGCAHPGRVWVCGRSAGRSDSCASREPPLQDWLDNWQPRGTPCGPISSRACKPHLMTPPASQACRYWGLMRGVWHHQDRRRRGPRELTGIVDLTRGKDHPTARLLDLVPGRSGTVYKNWLEERGEQFRSGIQIATLDPFQGQQERHRLASSKTQPASSTPSISSSSPAMPQVRCVDASSKTRPVTADAQAIPSIKSGFSCAPRATSSPHANKNDSVRPSWQMRRISVLKSPTAAPSTCETSSIKTHPPKADTWPHTSSSAYQPVPSPKSLA